MKATPGEEEEALGDEDGGDQVADQPDDRDRVGGQPRLDQAVAGVGPKLLGAARRLATVAATAGGPGGRRRFHCAEAIACATAARR